MSALRIQAILVVTLLVSPALSQETPPYSPPVTDGLLTSYTNAELGFTVRYPVEFKPVQSKISTR